LLKFDYKVQGDGMAEGLDWLLDLLQAATPTNDLPTITILNVFERYGVPTVSANANQRNAMNMTGRDTPQLPVSFEISESVFVMHFTEARIAVSEFVG